MGVNVELSLLQVSRYYSYYYYYYYYYYYFDLITLLSIYLLGNLQVSQTVCGIRLSQEKEIPPIP